MPGNRKHSQGLVWTTDVCWLRKKVLTIEELSVWFQRSTLIHWQIHCLLALWLAFCKLPGLGAHEQNASLMDTAVSSMNWRLSLSLGHFCSYPQEYKYKGSHSAELGNQLYHQGEIPVLLHREKASRSFKQHQGIP